MSVSPDFIMLGKISGVFGVRGWLKVYSHTDPREGIVKYSPWYLKQRGEWVKVNVKTGHRQGKTIVAQLEGVNDRNQAETMIGLEIAVRKEQLPKLPKGKYYWSELEGLQVSTVDGVDVGVVDYVFATGANDVLVVKKLDDAGECLIPFLHDDVIKTVDLSASTMLVDWDPDF